MQYLREQNIEKDIEIVNEDTKIFISYVPQIPFEDLNSWV